MRPRIASGKSGDRPSDRRRATSRARGRSWRAAVGSEAWVRPRLRRGRSTSLRSRSRLPRVCA